eukprot:5166610-Pleurochrysis_carterae.AAC.4
MQATAEAYRPAAAAKASFGSSIQHLPANPVGHISMELLNVAVTLVSTTKHTLLVVRPSDNGCARLHLEMMPVLYIPFPQSV